MGVFLSFNSQAERRNYGGSGFIEFQFCKLPVNTMLKKIVAIRSIVNWQNDSLYVYVANIDIFTQYYSRIFDCGIYNNRRSGIVDIYGINYYAPSMLDRIIDRLNQEKPTDYETLIGWIDRAKIYNGFYILGI